MQQALAGIRIIDLSRLLPGPFGTMLLGDMGAEVIKIEDPNGGDPARDAPPMVDGQGALFRQLNRNKKSVTLNLKDPDGRKLLLKMATGADVLLEQFRPVSSHSSALIIKPSRPSIRASFIVP